MKHRQQDLSALIKSQQHNSYRIDFNTIKLWITLLITLCTTSGYLMGRHGKSMGT